MLESGSQSVKESFHPQDEYIEGNKKLEKLYDICDKLKQNNEYINNFKSILKRLLSQQKCGQRS